MALVDLLCRRPGRAGTHRRLSVGGEQCPESRVEESFEFLRELVSERLGTSPAGRRQNELVAQFAGGSIRMTPAGGFWVDGLNAAGMKENDFDVQFFPKWRSQHHQLGAAGYAIMKTSTRRTRPGSG